MSGVRVLRSLAALAAAVCAVAALRRARARRCLPWRIAGLVASGRSTRQGLPERFATLAATLLSMVAGLAASPAAAVAQDVSARAYLSTNQVGVGQQFVLNVEVSGTQGVDQDPELPDMTAFSVYLGSGSSSSVQMSGGRTSIRLTIQYRFQATRAGTFTIDPIEVRAGGGAFATEPLTLTVSDAPVPQGPSRRARVRASRGIGPDDLFVEAVPSRLRVYENQPVVVDYRIFTRVNVSSYSITQLPSAAGFWVEEYPPVREPVIGHTVRNGQQYTTATIRKVALFPTGSGSRTLEPLGIEAQVRVRRSAFDPFEDFFGRGSLLNSTLSTAAASRPVEIEVLPLPGERPADFTGFVGDLHVTATLDRDSVQVSDAVTLTVVVSGSGNLRMLAQPEVRVPPGFEAFPPEVDERVDRTDAGVEREAHLRVRAGAAGAGGGDHPARRAGLLRSRAGDLRGRGQRSTRGGGHRGGGGRPAGDGQGAGGRGGTAHRHPLHPARRPGARARQPVAVRAPSLPGSSCWRRWRRWGARRGCGATGTGCTATSPTPARAGLRRWPAGAWRKRASWPGARTCAPSTRRPGTRWRAFWPTS